MKTYTKYSFLVAAIGLTVLGGCKKNSGGNDNNNGNTGGGGYVKTKYNTNPITANASCDYDMKDTSLTNHGWTKSFDDEFNDASNWGAVTGGVTKELECNEPANVKVSNGVMTITAKPQSITGPKTIGNDTTANFNFTSGWAISHATFSANSTTPKIRIVARIKCAAGSGLTSLFYGFGEDNWPTNGEIDYMEYKGDDVKSYSIDYFYGSTVGKNQVTDGLMFNPTTEDLSACYHVYVMEWTQNSLSAYLDGNLVTTSNGANVANLFGKDHHLALSLPIGGLYYTNLNSANVQGGTMTIDYVKVFTSH